MSRQSGSSLDRRSFLGRASVGAGALALGASAAVDTAHAGPRGIDERAVRTWLEHYRRAWVRRDPKAVIALFTHDAIYQEHPFQPAYVGREAIRGYWTTVTATQSDIQLRYGKTVLAGDKAAVEWWVNMRNGGADVTLAGEFMLTFTRGGLCSSLREYWFFSEGRLEPPRGWGE